MTPPSRAWAVPFLLAVGHSEVHLPSSCLGQSDGSHWLKLMENPEFPVIRQQCDNDYMIIDVNEDPNVVGYFSSYTTWHYQLSGPKQMDWSNWEEWWLPNKQFLDKSGLDSRNDYMHDEHYSYLISPDCNSCHIENNWDRNLYSYDNDDYFGDRTAYYMTGTLFGCLAKHKALKDCRWDYDSYTCNYCTKEQSDADLEYHVVSPFDMDDFNLWTGYYESLEPDNRTWWQLQMGICGVYPQSTYNDNVPQTRDECNEWRNNIKPSIGNDGKFCVCVKPNEHYNAATTYPVDEWLFEDFQKQYASNHFVEEDEVEPIDDVIELWQSDFEEGTYRIQESGTYKIMEDIVLDFNAGDTADPSSGKSWWPQKEQIDDYPGAGTTRDAYYLGFIAGITIEVDDVVIDLNEHGISMSRALYYQQRFFSIISLKSVAFPLNQGPGFFGMEPKYANNVVIKNGAIGLSSHHGIHGHFNSNVTIEKVHVHSFETHGIQMSHFQDLTIKNVEIGPSSTVAYLKGEYAYARWTVAQLERIMESGVYNDIFPVYFDSREDGLEFVEIVDSLKSLMDIAFKYVIGEEEYDDDDEDWLAAKDLFINEDGLPYGAVMYGLFLNLYFANVFTIHPSIKHANTANIEQLKIHGLHHKSVEYLRMDKYHSAMYRNQFNAPLDAKRVLGGQIYEGQDMVWGSVHYEGSPLTDASILLAMVTDDWGEQGLIMMDSNYTNWALGKHQWDDSTKAGHPYLGCNNDRMAHVPKGVIGIRMDGADNVTFRDLEISDLREYSDTGSDLCGEYFDGHYTKFIGGGNTLQNEPYLYGYTGNRAHGIFTDWSTFTLTGLAKIHDITCDTGLVRGMGLYTKSEMTFADDAVVTLYNFKAGYALSSVMTDYFKHPYNPSIAKPFHIIWNNQMETYDESFQSQINGEPADIDFYCIVGRDGMNDSDWTVKVDNTRNCMPLSSDPLSANIPGNMHQGLPPRPQHGHMMLQRAGYSDAQIASVYGDDVVARNGGAFRQQLRVSLWAAGVVAVAAVIVFLLEMMNRKRSKKKAAGSDTVCQWGRAFWRYIDILSSSGLRSAPLPPTCEQPDDECEPLIGGGSKQYGVC